MTLAEAEEWLRRAEERVREDPSEDNLRRQDYWRTVVRTLRGQTK